MKEIAILIIVLLISLSLSAQDEVTIGKYRKFDSEILGGEVTYLVHLPDGYEGSKMSYPVIYMMNGQSLSAFANASSTIDNLSDERVPDMILVGISNTGSAEQYWSCPDDSGNVKSGAAINKFLKEDLVPEVEKNYRTNGYKILFGQSNSSLFVLYNMLSQPGMFDSYVVASPMLGCCPQFFTGKLKAFANNQNHLKVKLNVSRGSLDYIEVLRYIDSFVKLVEQLPDGTRTKSVMIENSGHVPA